jgi:hypothetical protein
MGRRFSLGIAALAIALSTGCFNAKPASSAKKYEAPDERLVFFAQGRADILPEGFFSIGYVAAMLDADPAMAVIIVGHADQHGKAEASRELSWKRARAVRKVLGDHGIKDGRVRIAAPKEQSESSLAQLGRRVDLLVHDPKQEDVQKRIGYPVEVKDE